jgi:hypothetical protein
LFIQDILLSIFLKKLLLKYIGITKVGLIFVNTKIIRYYNNINIYLNIHDSFLDLFFYNYKKKKPIYKLKKKLYTKFNKKYRTIFQKVYQSKKFKKKLQKKQILHKFLIKKRNNILRNFLRIFVKQKFLKSF